MMQLDPQIVSTVLSAVVTGFAALFTFLVRSYFQKINHTLKSLGREIDKRDGRMEALSNEVRTNTKEVHGLLIEIRAVWRFMDNANKRTSDGGNYVRDNDSNHVGTGK